MNETVISSVALAVSLIGLFITGDRMLTSILALSRLRRAIHSDGELVVSLRGRLREAERTVAPGERDRAIYELLEFVLSKHQPPRVRPRDVKALHGIFSAARPNVRDDIARRVLAD